MDAKKLIERQIELANDMIKTAKQRIDECDGRIRRESFDAVKAVDRLSGASLGCCASNIIGFATDMARACSALQSAQDLKDQMERMLEMIENG